MEFGSLSTGELPNIYGMLQNQTCLSEGYLGRHCGDCVEQVVRRQESSG